MPAPSVGTRGVGTSGEGRWLVSPGVIFPRVTLCCVWMRLFVPRFVSSSFGFFWFGFVLRFLSED